ncbi:MAG: hypothetical protein CMQ61_11070 [Gammaproteobacteria bacterium]|nr:hypothetical protein [Gammaproteobacteria bacterium]|tara:strand:+ start:2805 stop:3344 length:540 start_codon:yes stop_codon:yes gene_type:complete
MLRPLEEVRVESILISPSETAPNNPRCPLLLYKQVLPVACKDPATLFEAAFDAHQWPSAWRNGIFAFHHYHSTAHEVLGIYSGEVTVCFGGAGGIAVSARAGDAIVVPAGVAHKRIDMRGSLGIVGAYPVGQNPDMCQTSKGNADRHANAVARVCDPLHDPLFGDPGPLLEKWHAAETP